MKINPEISNVINLVKKDADHQKKTQEKVESQSRMEDIISVENRAASRSKAESVEEARELLADVMRRMENLSADVHNLNQHRISQLIS
ncbi:MAG TPA: hypothetical protein PLA82_01785 [Deltaproteobacteria bacterium]|nr:hypothetical protein [Deltaproteobacteria bacterium]